MAHPNVSDDIEKVQAYITEASKQINALSIIPRRVSIYTFDTVALEIISKAFSLSNACLTLLAAGFPDEALGLSRSLVECSLTLRYLTVEPDTQESKTQRFAEYDERSQPYWLHQALLTFAESTEKNK